MPQAKFEYLKQLFERAIDMFSGDRTVGTAVACGADYTISNDKTWQRFEKVRVIPVGEL